MFGRQFPFRKKHASNEPHVRENRNSVASTSTASQPEDSNHEAVSANQSILTKRSNYSTSASSEDVKSIELRLGSPARGQVQSLRQPASGLDPFGLNVIYRPPGERRVDIIFVHGLGGSSRMTWSKYRDINYFWPEKFLPHEPEIKEARILSFGYNSNFQPGSGKSKMSILDFAKDLLYDLKYSIDDSTEGSESLRIGERPIIFVVHSMGGLVVKEAYLQGQNNPAYETIVQSISSIIFLSTPHRGTNLAETLNRILKVSFVSNPTQFIAELTSGSQTLQKLNEQFRHVAPKLQIVSFYETRPTPVLRANVMVLDTDSSILGYPGEISKALDADHHGVCKYEDPEDPLYISVRNVLKSFVEKALPNVGSEAPGELELQTGLGEFLQVTESPDRDYNFFRNQWKHETCGWIFQNEAFHAWSEDTAQNVRFLWMHGNAASGKSVLSSFIINHLVERRKNCQYFFIRFEDKKKRAISTVLRSIASQLARCYPTYAEQLQQLRSASAELKASDPRDLWQRLFKISLFNLENIGPVYWVIDGLDEAVNPEALIRLFEDLALVRLPVRVLVVSRQTHEISSALSRLGKSACLDTLRVEGNQDDLQRYIDHEMYVIGEASYREDLIRKILQRAHGNFLWVHLAVQKINKCHTRMEVQNVLQNLPPGMEALYDRMADSVQTQSGDDTRTLGHDILGWVSCAQRPLSIEELKDALGDEGLIEIHRTIDDLCGGFVVVDKDGKISTIHETARVYLTQTRRNDQRPLVNRKSTHDRLFRRCVHRLMDPSLRSYLHRNAPPALVDYATNAWFFHFFHAFTPKSPNLETLVKFLQSPHVLTWIAVAAKLRQLTSLISASRYLTDVAVKLRRIDTADSLADQKYVDTIESWAADLVKIIGKFGNNLSHRPESIYKLIPPLCPEESSIYRQFGQKESSALKVSGFSRSIWDDCLARLPLEQDILGSEIHTAGNHIAVLANVRRSGHAFVYDSSTFEEVHRIIHPERVFKIQFDDLGTKLAVYGYKTTKVWSMATGDFIHTVNNPPKFSRPHTLSFAGNGSTLMLVCEDRRCYRLDMGKFNSCWELIAHIEEQSFDDTIVNAPTCSSMSPQNDMVAFGYRGHPLTVWEIKSQSFINQCNVAAEESAVGAQYNTHSEVISILWHPYNAELFGLQREGLLFKWDLYDEQPSATTRAGAHQLSISRDGSLVTTGDTIGSIKVFTTADLSLLYQLSSQDPVLYLSFSVDSRRLYDVRGAYANVWEPNTLIRLAESPDGPDNNSHSWSDSESLSKFSLHIEHYFPAVSRILCLSGHSPSKLYCHGSEDGLATLCEVGRGRVCDLEKMPRYMSVEHLAWSHDGQMVGLAYLSGKVIVKMITKPSVANGDWQVRSHLQFAVPTHYGQITQLLYDESATFLLAATRGHLCKFDLQTQSLNVIPLPDANSQIKWACHPAMPAWFLGFGTKNMSIYSWSTLELIATQEYEPPLSQKEEELSLINSHDPSPSHLNEGDRSLGKLICQARLPDILLELKEKSTSTGRIISQYLLFSVKDIISDSATNASRAENTTSAILPYSALPSEVASCIREPLAFLPRRRLAFLDKNRWIVTWRMQTMQSTFPKRPQGGRGPVAEAGLEEVYMLPGDWATADEGQLCTMMTDGTLLCPRNGAVATVQAAKLSK